MTPTERSALLDRYRTGTAAVLASLEGAGDDELDRAPATDDDWTPRQIAHHLADSESMAYIRLRRLIAEDEPVIGAYDEPEWARRLHYDRPIDASLAVLAAVRTASLELLERLTQAEWARQGTHTESGPYSVEGWLAIYAEHAHDHADQIRRARSGEAPASKHKGGSHGGGEGVRRSGARGAAAARPRDVGDGSTAAGRA